MSMIKKHIINVNEFRNADRRCVVNADRKVIHFTNNVNMFCMIGSHWIDHSIRARLSVTKSGFIFTVACSDGDAIFVDVVTKKLSININDSTCTFNVRDCSECTINGGLNKDADISINIEDSAVEQIIKFCNDNEIECKYE